MIPCVVLARTLIALCALFCYSSMPKTVLATTAVHTMIAEARISMRLMPVESPIFSRRLLEKVVKKTPKGLRTSAHV